MKALSDIMSPSLMNSSISIPFFNEIKTQFEKLIKIFQSDNAKEYFFCWAFFLYSYDILHQFTCLPTSQQNGILDNKNRHLIESA